MKSRLLVNAIAVGAIALIVAAWAAGQPPPGAGQGYRGEVEHAANQLVQLAEAFPAEKYSWRPGPGVRSVAEVYMHIAIGNQTLLRLAGAKPSVDISKLGKEPEKSITAKPEIIAFLKQSFDALRQSYPPADGQKKVDFFGREATADSVFLRALVHNHEHMGQLIAYARMNGVVPPWSKAGGPQ